MKNYNVPPSLLEQVIADLKSLVPIHSIYCIASTNHHAFSLHRFNSEEVVHDQDCYELTLLLISYDKIFDHRMLSHQISEKSDGRIKTHLILYTYEEVYEKLEMGDNFLSIALNQKNCLYQESTLSVSNYMAFPAMYERIAKGWRRRVRRASYFMSSAEILDVERDEVARLDLINQMIYHSASSLLWVYWEWPTSTTDIALLLNLCKTFSRCPDTILKNSFEDQNIYSLLVESRDNLNFRPELEVSSEDVEIALEKAKEFYYCARVFGEERLVQLQKTHRFKSKISKNRGSNEGDNNGQLVLEPVVPFH